MFKNVNSPATSLDFFRFLLFYFLKIYCMIEISKESGDLNFMKKDIVFYFSLLLLSIFLSYKTQSDYATGIVYILCRTFYLSIQRLQIIRQNYNYFFAFTYRKLSYFYGNGIIPEVI